MSTVKEIVEKAHRLLGVLASGETLSGPEVSDGLDAFRAVVDEWSVEGQIVPVQSQHTFSLSPTKRTYTWGLGQDFSAPPPLNIIAAWFNEGLTDWPVVESDAAQHARTLLKDISARPEFFWADKAATVWTIYFNVLPIDASVSFTVDEPLVNSQALTAETGFPRGFDDALAHCLAIDIAPEFGVEVSPQGTLYRNARRKKGNLNRRWARVPTTAPDPAVAMRSGRYDIRSGP
ncbi:MAG: hypothetical protein AAGI03_00730 [Pseudomonadota bacterium]